MPVIGVMTMEISIPHAQSLKDKRSVVKGLKDRLRERHNVSVAEIDGEHTWQRATLAAVTVSTSRDFANKVLAAVERDAASILGGMLTDTCLEWLD